MPRYATKLHLHDTSATHKAQLSLRTWPARSLWAILLLRPCCAACCAACSVGCALSSMHAWGLDDGSEDGRLRDVVPGPV